MSFDAKLRSRRAEVCLAIYFTVTLYSRVHRAECFTCRILETLNPSRRSSIFHYLRHITICVKGLKYYYFFIFYFYCHRYRSQLPFFLLLELYNLVLSEHFKTCVDLKPI